MVRALARVSLHVLCPRAHVKHALLPDMHARSLLASLPRVRHVKSPRRPLLAGTTDTARTVLSSPAEKPNLPRRNSTRREAPRKVPAPLFVRAPAAKRVRACAARAWGTLASERLPASPARALPATASVETLRVRGDNARQTRAEAASLRVAIRTRRRPKDSTPRRTRAPRRSKSRAAPPPNLLRKPPPGRDAAVLAAPYLRKTCCSVQDGTAPRGTESSPALALASPSNSYWKRETGS
nr:MAG: hypothetical protein [Molluscum contagiosum virus]